MLIIRFIMVHMGPQHTQCGRKPAQLAPVLQMGLNAHKRPLTSLAVTGLHSTKPVPVPIYPIRRAARPGMPRLGMPRLGMPRPACLAIGLGGSGCRCICHDAGAPAAARRWGIWPRRCRIWEFPLVLSTAGGLIASARASCLHSGWGMQVVRSTLINFPGLRLQSLP